MLNNSCIRCKWSLSFHQFLKRFPVLVFFSFRKSIKMYQVWRVWRYGNWVSQSQQSTPEILHVTQEIAQVEWLYEQITRSVRCQRTCIHYIQSCQIIPYTILIPYPYPVCWMVFFGLERTSGAATTCMKRFRCRPQDMWGNLTALAWRWDMGQRGHPSLLLPRLQEDRQHDHCDCDWWK